MNPSDGEQRRADSDEQLRALRGMVNELLRRQVQLEARLERVEGGRTAPVSVPPPPPIPPQLFRAPPQPPPPPMPLPDAPPICILVQPTPAPPAPQRFEERVGLNWMVYTAVVTLLLGTAFAFKYLVDAGWIGPAARVLLGVATGIGTLLAGELLSRRNQKIFAQGITGLGLSLLYLSFYAAASLFHIVEPGVAFLLMAATTILAGWLSLKYESQAIALLGMLGGYITPLALSTGEYRPWVLFSYIFLLNSGALALQRVRPWKTLEPFAFVVTMLFYGGWFADHSKEVPVATTFAIAFYVQFALGRMRAIWYLDQVFGALVLAGIWDQPARYLPFEFLIAASGLVVGEYRKWRETPSWTLLWFWLPAALPTLASSTPGAPPEVFAGWITLGFLLFLLWIAGWMGFARRTPHAAELAALMINPAIYFSLMYHLLNPSYHEWMGLLAITLGALYLGIALWLGLSERQGMCATAVALAFVALAMPIQFTRFSISSTWALEALAVAWIKKEFPENRLAVPASGFLFTLASLQVLGGGIFLFADKLYRPVFNSRFLAFAVCVTALWITAWWFKNAVPYVAGHILLLSGLAFEVASSVIRNWPEAEQLNALTVALSILMAVYAVVLVTAGVIVRAAIHRVLGLILASFVILKLYFVDIWMLGRGFRIVAFLGLGALLLALSYLYSRFRESLNRLWKNETP